MAGRSKASGALTQEEFDQAISQRTGLADKSRDVAHAVLVRGVTPTVAAHEAGLSRARVQHVVASVYAAFLPPGWVREYVTLPGPKMKVVRAMESRERGRLARSQSGLRGRADRPGSAEQMQTK